MQSFSDWHRVLWEPQETRKGGRVSVETEDEGGEVVLEENEIDWDEEYQDVEVQYGGGVRQRSAIIFP